MTSSKLDNLVRIGQLNKETGTQAEFNGLLSSGRNRLDDARNKTNSLESRFDLAYNAAHAFCLAVLRWHGYRSNHRYTVFQSLPHTLDLNASTWRVLAKAHEHRNIAEYEGHLEVDEQLLFDLINAAEKVYSSAIAFGPVLDE
ncbi:hypothetical protein [Candidatus Thiodiazotropha sp. CDECU1]|uniref:hypothetical protein n=1 Tax=Candidatus Thiodiazotropha sp. CDECU1 TaxID=3065865 RepID=UPI0029312E99|nr:hypothetical protein [Candidatus Thiodiazotropha sp. CDECU1]